jgi:hypothetical protein
MPEKRGVSDTSVDQSSRILGALASSVNSRVAQCFDCGEKNFGLNYNSLVLEGLFDSRDLPGQVNAQEVGSAIGPPSPDRDLSHAVTKHFFWISQAVEVICFGADPARYDSAFGKIVADNPDAHPNAKAIDLVGCAFSKPALLAELRANIRNPNDPNNGAIFTLLIFQDFIAEPDKVMVGNYPHFNRQYRINIDTIGVAFPVAVPIFSRDGSKGIDNFLFLPFHLPYESQAVQLEMAVASVYSLATVELRSKFPNGYNEVRFPPLLRPVVSPERLKELTDTCRLSADLVESPAPQAAAPKPLRTERLSADLVEKTHEPVDEARSPPRLLQPVDIAQICDENERMQRQLDELQGKIQVLREESAALEHRPPPQPNPKENPDPQEDPVIRKHNLEDALAHANRAIVNLLNKIERVKPKKDQIASKASESSPAQAVGTSRIGSPSPQTAKRRRAPPVAAPKPASPVDLGWGEAELKAIADFKELLEQKTASADDAIKMLLIAYSKQKEGDLSATVAHIADFYSKNEKFLKLVLEIITHFLDEKLILQDLRAVLAAVGRQVDTSDNEICQRYFKMLATECDARMKADLTAAPIIAFGDKLAIWSRTLPQFKKVSTLLSIEGVRLIPCLANVSGILDLPIWKFFVRADEIDSLFQRLYTNSQLLFMHLKLRKEKLQNKIGSQLFEELNLNVTALRDSAKLFCPPTVTDETYGAAIAAIDPVSDSIIRFGQIIKKIHENLHP